ncbi:hypothetical protein AEQ67_13560 [Pseudomonas sp. RIT-PI-q]|uniref:DUF1654 domain-containing protein n=1 Tax=Pseudomonas sp. RIT-PI-q TaxID=1690247 RepID=UPI0006CCCBE4|nr:DUF1654 domain-containing protein [Pseudomonas sp. RIT-PI-q]KPG98373.1 hypothetical protein AEQ67_13560 [Pseudomonas sp. RIT-PI-q]
MTKAKQAPKPLTPYELLGVRIHKIINNPRSQAAKSALLERSANDSPEDWDQMLAEIAENDNVTFAHRDDGHVHIFWTVPKED